MPQHILAHGNNIHAKRISNPHNKTTSPAVWVVFAPPVAFRDVEQRADHAHRRREGKPQRSRLSRRAHQVAGEPPGLKLDPGREEALGVRPKYLESRHGSLERAEVASGSAESEELRHRNGYETKDLEAATPRKACANCAWQDMRKQK